MLEDFTGCLTPIYHSHRNVISLYRLKRNSHPHHKVSRMVDGQPDVIGAYKKALPVKFRNEPFALLFVAMRSLFSD